MNKLATLQSRLIWEHRVAPFAKGIIIRYDSWINIFIGWSNGCSVSNFLNKDSSIDHTQNKFIATTTCPSK